MAFSRNTVDSDFHNRSLTIIVVFFLVKLIFIAMNYGTLLILLLDLKNHITIVLSIKLLTGINYRSGRLLPKKSLVTRFYEIFHQRLKQRLYIN